MNLYFLIAGLLCFPLGIAHSLLGEVLIFKEKRQKGQIVPNIVNEELKERHLRIIWATWHMCSVFGFSLGVILIYIALNIHQLSPEITQVFVSVISLAMFLGGFFVLGATKAKHPGWIVFLIIGILLLLGL